ncbi:hypothetical protein [Enterococcus sp. AZ180]|uniref:hypothetical protein n=1 Tax=Enterococcus sp. AZ180 TaxID=2774961 RepID=UPI003F274A42
MKNQIVKIYVKSYILNEEKENAIIEEILLEARKSIGEKLSASRDASFDEGQLLSFTLDGEEVSDKVLNALLESGFPVKVFDNFFFEDDYDEYKAAAIFEDC